MEDVNTRMRRLITTFDPDKTTEEQVIKEIVTLIKAGGDPRQYSDFLLRLAARHGLLNVVKFLIKKCKADDSVYHFEALAMAIDSGYLNVARFLIKRMPLYLK